jgi:hypothetical protein
MDHVTGQRNDKVLVIVDNVHDKGISSIFYVMDTYGYNYYSIIFISEDLTNEWYKYYLQGPMG